MAGKLKELARTLEKKISDLKERITKVEEVKK